MPRVTQRDQYKRHLFLRTVWMDPGRQAYLLTLSASDQQKLHTFYRPSEELTLEQFRDHLHAIRHSHPHLRHISGKLYLRVESAVAQHTQRQVKQKAQAQDRTRNKTSARRGGPVVVYGVVRPKPDIHKLLKALIEMAREEQDEDDESKD